MRKRCVPEHWVSHNKVLNSATRLRQPGRNPNFETEETKLLISLWGKPEIQKNLITSTKKYPIIQNLSNEMKKHGYRRSPEEINTRIKNLKCFYNRMKKDIEMGILREPTWRHYEAMEKVLTTQVFGRNQEIASILSKVRLNISDRLKGEECLLVPKEEPMDITQPEIKIEIEEDFPLIVESDQPMDFPVKPLIKLPEVPPTIIKKPNVILNTGIKPFLYTNQPPPPLTKNIPIQPKNSTMKVIFVNKLPSTKESPKIDPVPKITIKPPENQSNCIAGLLKQIMEQQKEQMEIERERLSLEKERFQFEQEIGGKLLEVLPAILELTKKMTQLEEEDEEDVDI